MNTDIMLSAASAVQDRWPDLDPVGAMILGSGWSPVVDSFSCADALPYDEIPGLGRPGIEGHAGRLVRATLASGDLLVFQGRRHYYEGEGWTPIAVPLFILKVCAVPVVLLTNAAGGINPAFRVGDLMIIRDHINFMGANPLVGPHDPRWGARFPDQSTVYREDLCDRLHRAGATHAIPMHEGIYLAGTGPTYETPAEIGAFRTLGADAVGMSTVPEAILANAAGLQVAGLSCITNLAAGISGGPLTHEEVTETTHASMECMKRVVGSFWEIHMDESA